MEETVPSSSSHAPMPETRDGGDDEPGQAEPMPEIRQRAYDDRGWAVLDCLWSGPGMKIVKMKIRNGKPLELVLEESVPLRVYVNPVLTGYDEWEKPPGSGNRMLVGTPTRELERHGIMNGGSAARGTPVDSCTASHHCIPLGFSAMAMHSRSDAGAVSPRCRCNSLLQANGAKLSGGGVR